MSATRRLGGQLDTPTTSGIGARFGGGSGESHDHTFAAIAAPPDRDWLVTLQYHSIRKDPRQFHSMRTCPWKC